VSKDGWCNQGKTLVVPLEFLHLLSVEAAVLYQGMASAG